MKRRIATLVLSTALSACSLSPRDTVRVHFQFGVNARALAGIGFDPFALDCYQISVSAPDIAPTYTDPVVGATLTDISTLGLGRLTPLIPREVMVRDGVFVAVPTGAQRKFTVLGYTGMDNQPCLGKTMADVLNRANPPVIYVLGIRTQDIAPGAVVEINPVDTAPANIAYTLSQAPAASQNPSSPMYYLSPAHAYFGAAVLTVPGSLMTISDGLSTLPPRNSSGIVMVPLPLPQLLPTLDLSPTLPGRVDVLYNLSGLEPILGLLSSSGAIAVTADSAACGPNYNCKLAVFNTSGTTNLFPAQIPTSPAPYISSTGNLGSVLQFSHDYIDASPIARPFVRLSINNLDAGETMSIDNLRLRIQAN